MYEKIPDYEVRIKGHALVRVNDGDVCVDGKNFHADIKALSSLITMLNDVLRKAETEARPKAVTCVSNLAHVSPLNRPANVHARKH